MPVANPPYVPVEPVIGNDKLDVTLRTPTRDLLLTAQSGSAYEFDLTYNAASAPGDLALVSGTPSIAQHIRMRLLLFEGEMYNDTGEGTPYFQQIFQKGMDANLMRGIFRDRIVGTPGVSQLNTLSLSFDRPSRSLYVSWTVTDSNGQLLSDMATLAVTPPVGVSTS